MWMGTSCGAVSLNAPMTSSELQSPHSQRGHCCEQRAVSGNDLHIGHSARVSGNDEAERVGTASERLSG